MARSRKSQSKHDARASELARRYENQGFDVKADVGGFSKPATIGGYRPDVVAKKGRVRKIVEVETPASADSARDVKQQQAFRQAANRSVNTTFRRDITE